MKRKLRRWKYYAAKEMISKHFQFITFYWVYWVKMVWKWYYVWKVLRFMQKRKKYRLNIFLEMKMRIIQYMLQIFPDFFLHTNSIKHKFKYNNHQNLKLSNHKWKKLFFFIPPHIIIFLFPLRLWWKFHHNIVDWLRRGNSIKSQTNFEVSSPWNWQMNLQFSTVYI